MALVSPDIVTDPTLIDQAKRTYYKYNGKEIVAARGRGRPKVYRNPAFYDMDRKTEAATLYCVYGNVKEVAKILDLPEKVLKEWKQEPWWFEIQKQVFIEQNEELAAKLSTTLAKTIDEINERLENGDYTYNPKTGNVTRKPMEAKVVAGIFDSLAHQRRLTRGEPTQLTAKVGVDDRLKRLEESFIKFAEHKIVEGEVIG